MKTMRPVAGLAVLIAMASAPALALKFTADSIDVSDKQGTSTGTGFLMAQAAEPDAVAAARSELKAAEDALSNAEANNGDIDGARKAVKKARRVLAQAIADAGLPLKGETPEAGNTPPPATAQTGDITTDQPAVNQPVEGTAEPAPVPAESPKELVSDQAPAEADQPQSAREKRKKLKQQRQSEKAQAKAAAEGEAKKEEEAKELLSNAEPLPVAPTGIQGEKVDPKVESLRKKLNAERQKVRDLEARQATRGDGPTIRGTDNRSIIQLHGQIIIRNDSETDRILRGADDIEIIRLPRGRMQTIVTRPNGVRIITIRDLNGDIIYRVREQPNGRKLVLIDNRPLYEERRPLLGVEIQLPPFVLNIPRRDYIIEMGNRIDEDDIRFALLAPPVEQVERPYTLEEIRYSERLRQKLRRIDVSITFDTGSAAISQNQVPALERLALAMDAILDSDPDTIFLIEGHTDAVGSQIANLVLSDRRAESVAIALSEFFDIPPENMVTQGYGEAFPKIPTLEAERRNRRVAVRNITGLIRVSNR